MGDTDFSFPHAWDKDEYKTLPRGLKAIDFAANEVLTSLFPLSTAKWRRVLPSESTLFSMSLISFCLDLTANDIARKLRAVNRIPPIFPIIILPGPLLLQNIQGKVPYDDHKLWCKQGGKKPFSTWNASWEKQKKEERERMAVMGQNAYRDYWVTSSRTGNYFYSTSWPRAKHIPVHPFYFVNKYIEL